MKKPSLHRIALAATAILAAASLTVCAPSPVETAPSPLMNVVERDIAFLDSNTALLRFDPPPIYSMWMAEVEQCSGHSRRGHPTYYIAPVVTLKPDGRLAMYVNSEQRVVFGLGAEDVAWIVRHEQLHFVLAESLPPAPPGETTTEMQARTHPDEYFAVGGKCGTLVNPPAQHSRAPSAPRDGTTVRKRYA